MDKGEISTAKKVFKWLKAEDDPEKAEELANNLVETFKEGDVKVESR